MTTPQDKQVNVVLKFLLDGPAENRVKTGVSSIEKELERVQFRSLTIQQKMIEIGEGAEKAGRKYRAAFLTGTAIVGGIFAAAQRYVTNAKEATELTRAWTRETLSLQKSQSRIGEVLAREALPLLKQAGDIADKVAGFVEKHPEIVQAALKTGVMVAGLAAVGMAATKGIKLVADISYISASAQQLLAGKLMADAATKQIGAAGLGGVAKLGGGAVAGGTLAASAALIGQAIGLALVTYLAAEGTRRAVGAITGKETSWGEIGTAAKQIVATDLGGVLLILNRLGVVGEETTQKTWELIKRITGLGEAAEDTADQVDGAIDQLAGSQYEEQIVKAYTDMLEQEKAATEKYNETVTKITQDAAKEMTQAAQSNQKAIAQIGQNYQKQIQSITANYQKNQLQSEQSYATSRAQIVRDGGTEIQRMEKDHQERLRKMAMEHNDRVEDLVNSRDALGLVREMRDYNRQRAEETRSTNEEIARRRADLRVRLNDMAQQFARERAQRLAEYQQSMKEAAANKAEQLKQQRAQYEEEMRQIRIHKADALRELADQLRADRERRRAAFLNQVRDLDANLLGEQNQKRKYYAAMLKDAEAFLAAYRSKLPTASTSGGTIPKRDTGGYATKGVYGLAQDGRTEFVLSGPTTRAAEDVIGQSLTQQNLLAALKAVKQGINYNDNRRIDSRLSMSDRRAIKQDTLEVIQGVLG